jgi:hypothetical protein
LSCAICEVRKEKRFCPAVHGKICPQCCGEQREVTLDCPGDCPYLLQARSQARGQAADFPGWVSEIEIPDVAITEQFLYEREELILGLSFALAKSARKDRSLIAPAITDRSITDSDLITAIGGLAKQYETLAKSALIYEPTTTNLVHQNIARDVQIEVQNMIKEFRALEQQHTGQSRLRDSDVLKALVFLLRMGLSRTSGRPKSRAFIDFLFERFPEKQSAIVGPRDGSRLVIP